MGFPIRFQLESIDCGPTCIQMLAAFYGKNYSLDEIKKLCNPTRLGISLYDIISACNEIGLKAIATQPSIEELGNIPLPCILFWKQEHFVVLYRIESDRFYIADPGYGKVVLDTKTFKHEWLSQNNYGIAILIAPTSSFQQREPQKYDRFETLKSMKTILSNNSSKNRFQVYKIFVFSVIIMLSTWSIPFLYQQIIDSGIEKNDYDNVVLFALLQFSAILGGIISNNIINIVLTKIGFRISIDLLTKYLRKLISLPISFFDVKLNTDLIQRIDDQSRIESFLTKTLHISILGIFSIVVYLCILSFYNIYVFIIFLLISGISVFYSTYFLRMREIVDYARFSATSESKNRIYELINGMPDIKLNSAQENKMNQWMHIQNRINSITLKSLHLNFYINGGNVCFDKLKDILVMIGCAYYVMEEDMSLGMMMTIMYLLGQLSSNTTQLFNNIQEFQNTTLAYKRINEIFNKIEENSVKKNIEPCVTKRIKFNNVSFTYPGSFNREVLKNINLNISKGETVAIVGPSGSGKTTLLKLLLSFYSPQNGNILLDETSLNQVNTDKWRAMCGVVMQDGYIFSGTIAENIALSDTKPNLSLIKKAAKIACIDDFVEQLPMKYNTKIGRVGINLSGGQKQRLLIARAVYKNPDFIFLDEATSSLDANTEHCIVENLQHFYKDKTVVVVAHRLSTVKNADKIIYLEAGCIVEKGTHKELSERKGAYYNLIKNQLEIDS